MQFNLNKCRSMFCINKLIEKKISILICKFKKELKNFFGSVNFNWNKYLKGASQ